MKQAHQTFLQELSDIYDAEKQLLRALPKMAAAADHPALKEAFEVHLEETREQIERLGAVFKMLHEEPVAKIPSRIMEAILTQTSAVIRQKGGDPALISCARKIEHYEIATYGSLYSWARFLRVPQMADLLHLTQLEEVLADEQLIQVADTLIAVSRKKPALIVATSAAAS